MPGVRLFNLSPHTIAMKYLPVVDLWNPALAAAVRTGQLKLQPGQWVRCGSAQPSRFVKASSTSVWAVHPEGDPAGKRRVSNTRFRALLAAASR